METKQERKFKSAPGWALAEHVMTYEVINDADAFQPSAVRGNVVAYKQEDKAGPAKIKLDIDAACGVFALNAYMTPDRARRLAAALIEAADICEAFDAQQAEVTS